VCLRTCVSNGEQASLSPLAHTPPPSRFRATKNQTPPRDHAPGGLSLFGGSEGRAPRRSRRPDARTGRSSEGAGTKRARGERCADREPSPVAGRAELGLWRCSPGPIEGSTNGGSLSNGRAESRASTRPSPLRVLRAAAGRGRLAWRASRRAASRVDASVTRPPPRNRFRGTASEEPCLSRHRLRRRGDRAGRRVTREPAAPIRPTRSRRLSALHPVLHPSGARRMRCLRRVAEPAARLPFRDPP
jgi:hypothetical protein